MSGPAHTPTPWVVEEGHIQRDSNGIRYWQITDGQDAIACNQFCYAGYDPAVNAANAAAIVHRMNNWDAVVEALDFMVNVSRSTPGFSPMAREQAERALAKARGEA